MNIPQLTARLDALDTEQTRLETKIQRLFIEVGAISESLNREVNNVNIDIHHIRARIHTLEQR